MNMKKYVAEFIGTLVLTLFGCGSVAISGGIDGKLGILGIAMAFGLSIVAMAYAIGDVSGCHINPAVSLGVFLTGGMDAKDFVGYLVAQFLGGIAGAGLLCHSSNLLYLRRCCGCWIRTEWIWICILCWIKHGWCNLSES